MVPIGLIHRRDSPTVGILDYLLADREIGREIGRDPAGDIITEFAAVGLPTTVFVTADGEITVAHTGDVRAELDAALEALVAA